jgi:hypothetical protein
MIYSPSITARTEATNALLDAATATPATLPVAVEAAITAADCKFNLTRTNCVHAEPVSSPLAGDDVTATSPVAGEAAITALDCKLNLTRTNCVHAEPVTSLVAGDAAPAVNPMGAVAVAEAPLEPVMTPAEVERQLSNVESATGKWFLVTQGLEPGVYSSWYVSPPVFASII